MATNPLSHKYSTPQESPGFILWQVSLAWQKYLNKQLRPLGITHAQLAMLGQVAWLTHIGKTVTQAEVAYQAGASLMMTSQVLRSLEKKGLIVRKIHPTDTRAKIVTATDQGVEIVKNALNLIHSDDDNFFGLNKSDKKELLRLLQKVKIRNDKDK